MELLHSFHLNSEEENSLRGGVPDCRVPFPDPSPQTQLEGGSWGGFLHILRAWTVQSMHDIIHLAGIQFCCKSRGKFVLALRSGSHNPDAAKFPAKRPGFEIARFYVFLLCFCQTLRLNWLFLQMLKTQFLGATRWSLCILQPIIVKLDTHPLSLHVQHSRERPSLDRDCARNHESSSFEDPWPGLESELTVTVRLQLLLQLSLPTCPEDQKIRSRGV